MNKWPEVPADKLYKACKPSFFKFKTTQEVPPIDTIIGQNRAQRAVEFGLRINKQGYNIFLAGLTGTGKLTHALAVVQDLAKTQPMPRDWCYVNNFDRPSQPQAISLPAGMGKEFVKDVRDLIADLKTEITKAFDSEDLDRLKHDVFQKLEDDSDDLFNELNETAKGKDFVLKRTTSGFVILPVVNGETVSEENFENLDEETQQEIEEKSAEVQVKAAAIASCMKKIEREAQDQVRQLEADFIRSAIEQFLACQRTKYKAYPEVLRFLAGIEHDIFDNLADFRPEEEEDASVALLMRKKRQDPFSKYEVNLIVDSSEAEGAPIVHEPNPTFTNLIGRVEYENELGSLSTNQMQIKAGALHRANGGYLILQARDVLSHPQAWEALKRVLRTKEVRIENPSDNQGANVIATQQPEPIPVDLKVIMTGGSEVYQALYQYDEEFEKLFKIKAEFDDEMVRSSENIHKMAAFISSHCHNEGLRHFDRTAVAKVIEYSSRLAEDQEKLSTCFNDLVEILYEADAWADLAGSQYVAGEHITKAVEEKKQRSNLWEEKLGEKLQQGIILLDTTGSKVGQINGLTIMDIGDYVFGKPCRITASTFVGEEGVINIERETRMSGKIHDKGLLVLSGYVGAKYAQNIPLSLSASLCFEQLYDGVDGDSASSTELYALLSSLAELPIKQSLAVTGSVNQKGEIQPIGGVNQKIEGFYETCKARGLTGDQGVLIPQQNLSNLMLKQEVIQAVRRGKFHIYPVQTIDQGIELLTGVEAGTLQADGTYPAGTVHYLVQEKLNNYSAIMAAACD